MDLVDHCVGRGGAGAVRGDTCTIPNRCPTSYPGGAVWREQEVGDSPLSLWNAFCQILLVKKLERFAQILPV